jgi:DNA-binding MarR family transcriptional regulator
VAEEVYGEGEMSAGRRGVLRDLARHGPQSVPQLARRRPVSRQLIQSLVNPLARDGWVELVPNPAHRRSPLVRLTAAGESRVAEMALREGELLARLETGVSEREVARAAQVLRAVRASFESPGWRELLDSARPRRRQTP